MNTVKEIGPALFCGSWRIRDGVLSHRYRVPGILVDLLGLNTRFQKRLLSDVLKRTGDLSKGDRRDLENILFAFIGEVRKREEVNRLLEVKV